MRILLQAQSRGHSVDVFAYDWQGDQPKGVTINLLPVRALTNHGRNRHFLQKLSKTLDRARYDAVVGFNRMPGLDLYYGADYCYIARAKPKYAPIYRLTPRFYHQSQFERAVFDAHSHTTILSLSEREKGVYQQHYGTPESRFVLMPPTLDIQRKPEGDLDAKRLAKRQELGLNDDHKLILFIGSGFKTKGLDRAILAVSALPSELQNESRLYVVGQDNAQSYRRLIEKLNLSADVRFLGGRNDVSDLMLAGDILLHPAYSENTGTVILEAIASGLPVIATDVCGYSPHIDLAEAGYVMHSPFSQAHLNHQLAKMLVSGQQAIWRENGRRYGQNPSLYQMPQTAVRAIEHWVAQSEKDKARATLEPPADGLYLPPELGSRFMPTASVVDVVRSNGILVKETGHRRVLRFSHQHQHYYLKTHSSIAWHTLIRHLLRGELPESGAQREWHAAHHLHRLRIPTIHPVACGTHAPNAANRHGFIISTALDACAPLRQYLAHPGTFSLKQRRQLVGRIADIVRDLHNSGANHGALTIDNLWLGAETQPGAGHEPAFTKVYLLNLDQMRIRRRTPRRAALHDLATLWCSARQYTLSRHDRWRFMRQYRSSSLRDTVRHDRIFWREVQTRSQKLAPSRPLARIPACPNAPKDDPPLSSAASATASRP